MKIFHIGTIAIESIETKRELKSIGGISGYILELIGYSQERNIEIGFIGKIYNYQKSSGIKYIEIQEEVTGTIQFLLNLFITSFIIPIPTDVIIHAHRPDHLAALMFFKNRPAVISLHGQQAHTVNIRKGRLIRSIYKILEKYAFGKAKTLIAVDDITNEFYSKLYPHYKHKLITIPTGVNTDVFKIKESKNLNNSYGIKPGDKVIVYVGRIEPPKRLDVLLESFKLIISENKNYKLLIIGDGVLRAEMEKKKNQLNLQDSVQFLGVRKREELADYFNMADVSILLSDNEGSPLSVKESLACGTPVIANDVGDIKSIIENNVNGFMVNITNIQEISAKVVWAASNSKQLQEACVKSIQFYTISKVSQKVLEIYNTLENEK